MTKPDPRIVAALEVHKGEQVTEDFFDFTARIVEPVVKEREAQAWDECCKAFGWALDNGTREDALRYVPTHNPYRDEEGDDE